MEAVGPLSTSCLCLAEPEGGHDPQLAWPTPHLLQPRLHPAVVTVRFLKHGLAGEAGLQLGTDEERATHLAVQRVGLLRRRDEAVLQHNGDQVMDLLSGALRAKVEGLFRSKGLPQDENGIQVGILHGLDLITSEELHLYGFLQYCLPVLVSSSPDDLNVEVSKGSVIFSSCPKVQESHLVLLRVIKEIGPVGVSLHDMELKQLPQAQHQNVVADLGMGWGT